MAVQLSQGAIERMCNGDLDIKPILQVMEIRLVNTSNQPAASERYRMMVSDGTHSQQGMLATQRNELVKTGVLQKGSIVLLHKFVCNSIQERKVIIIIELEVIQENCDPIGQPTLYVLSGSERPPQLQSSADQRKTLYGSPQLGNAQSPNLTGGPSLQPPRLEHSPLVQSYSSSYASNSPLVQAHISSYASNSDTGRFAPTNPPLHPRPGFGSGNAVASSTAGGFNNSRTQVSHSLPNSRPVNQQPPPMYMNRGPIAKNEAPPRIIPIAALNPYQGRWTIMARVTAKTVLRHYTNARGDGKVFSFDLLDSDGGEIRVTCFNAVADQFFNQIEVGRVYLISKGSLKPAQKNFNHLRNDHEIFLESTSVVQPCSDDDSSIPRQQFCFCSISDVEGMENNKIVDIIGIVSSINPTTTIMKKDSTETQKRSLQLKDMSGKSVELVLWGNFCNAEGQELQSLCDSGQFPVLAIKAARINEFNGKAVGSLSISQLFIEPDIPEARTLKEWFDREGRNTPCVSISRENTDFSRTDVRKTISQIKDEKLGTSEKPDYITVCAHISFMKLDNFCYTACPIMVGERKCSKKVTNNGDGKWHCDRCDQSVDECEYRYILQCQIQDHTGITWITAFQEFGEEIIGMPAKELFFLKYEEQDDEKFSEIIRRVLFSKYILKLKVKEETFNDEQRVKSTVVKADMLNFSSEARFLVDLMTKLKSDGSNTPFNAGNNYATGQPTASSANYGGTTGFSAGATGPSTNQAGAYGAQFSGSRHPMGNTSGGTFASCSSCGGTGHSAANCPSVNSGPGYLTGGYVSQVQPAPGAGGSSGEECFKCHQMGHWSRDCPNSSAVTPSGSASGGASGECYKCHQTGHWANNCPSSNVAGGGGGGAGKECFKCHQFGHWAKDCPGISSVPPAYGSYGMQKQNLGHY